MRADRAANDERTWKSRVGRGLFLRLVPGCQARDRSVCERGGCYTNESVCVILNIYQGVTNYLMINNSVMTASLFC
jgi:hypothetical protein